MSVRGSQPSTVESSRRRLPRVRASSTLSFRVGEAAGTFTTGTHPDGQLGEIFLRWGKQGSTLAGMSEAFSIATSLALQHGAPTELIADRLRDTRFEPAGATDDREIPNAASVMDYLARRLAADFGPPPPN